MKKNTERGEIVSAAVTRAKEQIESESLQKKVVFDMPRSLYRQVEVLVDQMQITTSAFVRQGVEMYVDDLRRKQLEKELEEGYLANAAVSEQTMKDFEFVDDEQR